MPSSQIDQTWTDDCFFAALPEDLHAQLEKVRERRNFNVAEWVDKKTDMLVCSFLSDLIGLQSEFNLIEH